MSKALITIGMAFRNPGEYVFLCIKSILAQTFQDWKLIAMDDGSTDSSLEIIRAVRDSRIQVVSDGQSLGLVARLNRITELADTEFLARMDADDIMHPHRLAIQCALLENCPEKTVVGSAAYIVDDATNVIGIRQQHSVDLRPASVLRRGIFIHPTIIGRRGWFVRNPYGAEYVRAEDRELWCRTFSTTNFGVITRPLLFYRDRGCATEKYRISCRADRKIFRKYGPQYVGMARTLGLITASHAKEAIYRASGRLGFERILIAARNTTISEMEAQEAAAALEAVIETPLPGIEHECVFQNLESLN